MADYFLRWIAGATEREIADEILKVEPHGDADEFLARMNRDYVFKFIGLSAEDARALPEILEKLGIVYIFSENAKPISAIISCANRRQRDELRIKMDGQLPRLGAEFERMLKNMAVRNFSIESNGKVLSLRRTRLMGILNLTPDSFSDGGKFLEPAKALAQAEKMEAQGVDIFDLGAESTRPGAQKVSLEEEWRRIEPVLRGLRKTSDKWISVDTYKAEIARRAVEEGADMINDISAMTFDPEMPATVARGGVAASLMHIQGTPQNMQENPRYESLMEDVLAFLRRRAALARDAGIRSVIVDPGIGFGKTASDNYRIIRRLAEFKILGSPILMGLSRKSFLNLTGNRAPSERGAGSEIMHAMSLLSSANILRVHDVCMARYCADIMEMYSGEKN